MVNFILCVHILSQFFKKVIGVKCITYKKVCIKKDKENCYFIFQKTTVNPFFLIYLFNLFIFGCVGSLLLCTGFL